MSRPSPGHCVLHWLRAVVVSACLRDLLTIFFQFLGTLLVPRRLDPDLPRRRAEESYGFHPLVIRPLQLQPPCRVRLTLAFTLHYVVMFFFVIVFMVAFPAGVRKNPFGLHLGCALTSLIVIALLLFPAGVRKSPIGLHLRCMVVSFFVVRVFTLPAGVRMNPSGLHMSCLVIAVAISITAVRRPCGFGVHVVLGFIVVYSTGSLPYEYDNLDYACVLSVFVEPWRSLRVAAPAPSHLPVGIPIAHLPQA